MHTETCVRGIGDSYGTLCALAARLIPSLKWRHNGLGLLQAYIYEGTTDELRLHIWHESLRRPGIEDSGLLHDHRFDLTSRVLVGEIKQVEFLLTESLFGKWALHSVVHARAALGDKHAPNDGLMSPLSGRYTADEKHIIISEREAYFFPKRIFHGTYMRSPLVVTLVTKSDQEETPARIMAPWGKPVVHAFEDPQPESEWQGVLWDAKKALEARQTK